MVLREKRDKGGIFGFGILPEPRILKKRSPQQEERKGGILGLGILGEGRFFEPELAIYPPINKELEAKREAKKRDWEVKGYPSGLIEKGLLLADRWVSALADAFGAGKREVQEAIIRGSYEKGLEVAESWIKAMLK